MGGYHLNTIPQGKHGEFSKIEEEFAELRDAVKQDVVVMVLLEMSDLIGAMEAYISKYGVSLDDIVKMTRVTQRAFKAGERKPKC